MTQYQQHELSRIDGEIAELEKKIAVKHEQRRELVNRMGLNKGGAVGVGNSYVVGESGSDTLMPNKCEHKNLVMMQGFHVSKDHPENIECHDFCTDCGAKLAIKSKCLHQNSTCVDVTAMSDAKPMLVCYCDDCGCQLPWQNTELKP